MHFLSACCLADRLLLKVPCFLTPMAPPSTSCGPYPKVRIMHSPFRLAARHCLNGDPLGPRLRWRGYQLTCQIFAFAKVSHRADTEFSFQQDIPSARRASEDAVRFGGPKPNWIDWTPTIYLLLAQHPCNPVHLPPRPSSTPAHNLAPLSVHATAPADRKRSQSPCQKHELQ